MWSRRRIIFVGVLGAVAGGAAVLLPRAGSKSASPSGRALTDTHGGMLRSVASALLSSALPTTDRERMMELDRIVGATAALVDNLPPTTRAEIGDLFGLLAVKPARALLGYSGDWSIGDTAAVSAFLGGLRESSIGLKQQAYFALHDLVMGSFYSDALTWAATGYPGPPKLG